MVLWRIYRTAWGYQTAPHGSLGLPCGLYQFMSLTEDTALLFESCHKKTGPPFLVPRSKYIKIFGPPDNLFQFNLLKYLDPPEQKFLKYLDLLEIFYPPSFYQHIA